MGKTWQDSPGDIEWLGAEAADQGLRSPCVLAGTTEEHLGGHLTVCFFVLAAQHAFAILEWDFSFGIVFPCLFPLFPFQCTWFW